MALKKITDDVLKVLVNLTCETLTSFSAYDVTCVLRKRLPEVNIIHEDVKRFVYNYANKNQMTVSDNGTYKVFHKKFVKNEEKHIKDNSKKSSILSKLLKMKYNQSIKKTEEPTKSVEPTVTSNKDPLELSKVDYKSKMVILPLNSERRVSLKNFVKNHLKISNDTVYIKKTKDSIVISGTKLEGYHAISMLNNELRFRINFEKPANVKYDKVSVFCINSLNKILVRRYYGGSL